jgi:DNA-binding transcriptional MerR regulator
MKTIRGIADELGIKKFFISNLVKRHSIKPIRIEGNRKYFDESSIKIIKQLLHLEEESEYQIFESKMNYESTIS